jgi:hypothetical protein
MPCKRAEQPLETCEPICVPGVARPFFIPVVHNPLGAMGYVAALELSSQGGRARSHGTCFSMELILSGRQGLELRDT